MPFARITSNVTGVLPGTLVAPRGTIVRVGRTVEASVDNTVPVRVVSSSTGLVPDQLINVPLNALEVISLHLGPAVMLRDWYVDSANHQLFRNDSVDIRQVGEGTALIEYPHLGPEHLLDVPNYVLENTGIFEPGERVRTVRDVMLNPNETIPRGTYGNVISDNHGRAQVEEEPGGRGVFWVNVSDLESRPPTPEVPAPVPRTSSISTSSLFPGGYAMTIRVVSVSTPPAMHIPMGMIVQIVSFSEDFRAVTIRYQDREIVVLRDAIESMTILRLTRNMGLSPLPAYLPEGSLVDFVGVEGTMVVIRHGDAQYRVPFDAVGPRYVGPSDMEWYHLGSGGLRVGQHMVLVRDIHGVDPPGVLPAGTPVTIVQVADGTILVHYGQEQETVWVLREDLAEPPDLTEPHATDNLTWDIQMGENGDIQGLIESNTTFSDGYTQPAPYFDLKVFPRPVEGTMVMHLSQDYSRGKLAHLVAGPVTVLAWDDVNHVHLVQDAAGNRGWVREKALRKEQPLEVASAFSRLGNVLGDF